MALSRLLLLLALSLGQAASSVDDLPDARRYCIIGAGPGGLQIGQFMHHRGRDYVTLERRDRAATFFDKYPRHRRLISINKRYTGRDNANFNMRHDWNSLLESEVPQMTTRTKERFPPADVLAEYLRDFATVQEEAGRIVYGVTVDEVARDADGEGFVLSVLGANSESPTEAAQIACEVVISCTGVGSANVPPNLDVPGAIGYDDLPAAEETERVFENKSIVVFGMGNAGMETSKALMPYAQYVHVFGGSKYKEHPLTSWEARYPGAIRATNAEIFDAYLLKSLDGGLADGNAGVYAKGAAVRRCGPGKSQFCLMNTKAVELANGTTFNAIVIPTFPTADARSVQFYQSIQRYIVDQKIGYRQDVELDLRGPDGIVVTASAHNTEAVSSLALPEAITEENIDEFVEVSKRQGRSYPHVYDHLIRCLGWSINKEMYSPQTLPQMQPNGKFPALTAEWESVNVKNLYFAGAASHGRDHKRAAGGFIHGFRYTARAMFTVLEEKYEAQPWPQQKFEVGAVSAQKDLQVVTEALLHRINTGDGPYPMTAVIGDGILLNCGEEGEEGEGSSDTMEMDYHFNVPIAAFHNKYETRPRIVFSFGYGDGQQRTLTESIQGGSLYEVMLWFYNGELGSDGYRKKTLVRLLEALHVNCEPHHKHNANALTLAWLGIARRACARVLFVLPCTLLTDMPPSRHCLLLAALQGTHSTRRWRCTSS